jgi:hypothetical protein
MVIDRENGERETLLSVENTYLHLWVYKNFVPELVF